MHFHLFHSLNTSVEWYSKGKGNFKKTKQNKTQAYQTQQKTVKQITLLKISFLSEFALTGCGIPPFPMEFLNIFSSWTLGSVCRFRWSHKGNINPGSLRQEELFLWQLLILVSLAAGTVTASMHTWLSKEMLPWSGTDQYHIRPPFPPPHLASPISLAPALADCKSCINKNGLLGLLVQPSSVTGSWPVYLLFSVAEN